MKKIMIKTILGLGSIFFLSGFSLFTELPECDSNDVKKLISQIVTEVGETFIGLKDISEEGYNSKKDIRLCSANLSSTAGSEYIQYHVSWQNKEKSLFWVQLVE